MLGENSVLFLSSIAENSVKESIAARDWKGASETPRKICYILGVLVTRTDTKSCLVEARGAFMEAAAAAARDVLRSLKLSLQIDSTPGYVAGVRGGGGVALTRRCTAPLLFCHSWNIKFIWIHNFFGFSWYLCLLIRRKTFEFVNVGKLPF